MATRSFFAAVGVARKIFERRPDGKTDTRALRKHDTRDGQASKKEENLLF
jgi:hypothetical protein